MIGFSLETACQRKKSLVLFLKAWWHYCDFPFQIHSLLHLFFSALTVFNCLSHWKKKRGDSFNDQQSMRFSKWLKPSLFLFNLWFVSQNFCLLVFCALDAVRQYWIYLMCILQIGVLVFDQIYDLVYHVIVASYIWMCIHSKKRRVLVLVICFNPQMAV